MKQFTCDDAKGIDLVEYLASLNHHPLRIRNQEYWYLSPLRNEKTPSFKVDRIKQVWFDHGLGKGGDIIDFGTLYHHCSIKELLQKLSHYHFRPVHSFGPPTNSSVVAGANHRHAGEKKESADSKIVVVEARPLAATFA